MITEDYVDFEIANLLKEKGFQQLQDNCEYFTTEMVYSITIDDNDEHHFVHQYPAGVYNKDKYIAAPTLQMTMKWLREVHNKQCNIELNFYSKWHFLVVDTKVTEIDHYEQMKSYPTDNSDGFSSYEEAAEVAIKYCLENLI